MRKETTKSLDKFFLVSNQPLFQALSDKEKGFVANRSQVLEYNKADTIYRKGQKKDFLYIVIGGRVSLFHPPPRTPQKKEITVEVLRKGDYFGIISLLTGRPHSLSARVLNDARILRIDERAFKQILNRMPKLAIHFSRVLSRRLKKKYTGIKEVFQTTILSVYYKGDSEYTHYYAANLASSIKRESGKRVIVINKPKGIDYILNNYAGNYHFVIVVLPPGYSKVTRSFLRQSDLCHIISDRDNKTRIIKKVPSDSKDIYATLPSDKDEFDKAIRRISRETSGVLVGLALGSGGAIGLAQIGVLKVLEEENIPIDIIAGVSIGALIGALWACGYKAAEIEKICTKLNTKLKTLTLIDITFPKRGLLAGRRIRKFLAIYLKNKTFYDIKLPIKIVACDIKTRDEVVITGGKLINAVMASIAIPGVFNPYVTKDKRLLVDGGIVNPVPISVLSKTGIKRIIAVNSMPSPEDVVKTATKKQTLLDIIVNSMNSMEYRIAKYACREADVYIHPILRGAAWYEFYRAKEFIELGKRETRKALPEIRKLIK
ncbi:MAG: patatin-like phospholipase family protein [Candidatus Omnitrophica bacterium]|nr:patatin-like phospholipase family protein [Candidatus Omnitrophota bacterium]